MTIRHIVLRAGFAVSLVVFASLTGALFAGPSATPASGSEASSGQAFDAAVLADQALAGVRIRLKLTDGQAGRIRPLLAEHLGKLRTLFASYSGEGLTGLPALGQEFRDSREKFRLSLEPILTPDQMKEFLVIRKEVDQQMKDTVCDARVAAVRERLALTAEQIGRVRPILCEDFERKREVVAMVGGRTGGPAFQRTPSPEIMKIQDATDARLREVLSPDQMKAYETYREEMRRDMQEGETGPPSGS